MSSLPKHTQSGLVVLSPTRVELGQRCLRKHTLADTVSYQPQGAEEAASLVFGERAHAAASIYWNTGEAEAGSEYLRAQVWPLNAKHTLALALQCWAGYVAKASLFPYATVDTQEEWEPIAIEERVVLDVQPGLKLSFQLDRLLRNKRTEMLCLVDLKTALRCDYRWMQQWPRSLQMKLYSAAIKKHYGKDLDWLVIEGLSKENATLNLVNVQPFTEAQREEAWRAMKWVAHHDSQLLVASTHTMLDGDSVVDSEKLLRKALTETPFSPAECFAYGSTCPYLPLCDAEPGERIALLRDGYEYVEPTYL